MSAVTQTTHAEIKDPQTAAKALTFFKVMAIIVGVGLLLLVAEVILHYRFQSEALSWWPQPHGFIFFVYVIATANLGFKVGWSLPKMVLVMLAGCVPFLSFVVERVVAREIDGRLALAHK